MIQILSEGRPHVLQLEAQTLIERFPTVKEHYHLEKPCNKSRFESFWCNLCKQELEKQQQQETTASIPRESQAPLLEEEEERKEPRGATAPRASQVSVRDPIMIQIVQLPQKELIESFPEFCQWKDVFLVNAS